MKSLKQFEKERIMKMSEMIELHCCPKCNHIVYPRRRFYKIPIGINHYSCLLWCPNCLKGEAAYFWKVV